MSDTGTDYLGGESVTDVARMVMAVMSELWIVRDRQIVTEFLLETNGTVSRDEIDNFAPPAELSQQIEAERERFARLIVGAPVAGVHRSVSDILERAGMDAPENPGTGL
tara:strand:- start:2186 stop:2512 length:327 start_codon:yes stop_codon:yes gene_type:complete